MSLMRKKSNFGKLQNCHQFSKCNTINMTSIQVTAFVLLTCFAFGLGATSSSILSKNSNDGGIQVNVVNIMNKRRFYTNHRATNRFNCIATGNTTVEKIIWLYGWSNGTYTEIKNTTGKFNSRKFGFPSGNITHVACVIEDSSGKKYHGTYNVKVKEANVPKILNEPVTQPIVYKPGIKLECNASGLGLQISWLKNGESIVKAEPSSFFNRTYDNEGQRSSSTLMPNPTLADGENTTYTCVVENLMGKSTLNFPLILRTHTPEAKYFKSEPEVNNNLNWKIAFGASGGALVFCLIAGTVMFARMKQKETPLYPQEKIDAFIDGDTITTQTDDGNQESQYVNAHFDLSREIKPEDLCFVRKLKSGNFGTVHLGEYLVPRAGVGPQVAIKSMKIKDQRYLSKKEIRDAMDWAFEEFLKEIKIMQALGSHPNCCQYIGAVTANLAQYTAYLVVEYCSGGDVAEFLRTLLNGALVFIEDTQEKLPIHKKQDYLHDSPIVELKSSLLAKWGRDIAEAMRYINARGILHRDLSARNVLLSTLGKEYHGDPEEYTVKVADFGLGRDLSLQNKEYYSVMGSLEAPRERPEPHLPVSWIALETLYPPHKFTAKSDIWSFGVTMFELLSFGASPYKDTDIPKNRDGTVNLGHLVEYLENGNRLECPSHASEIIWEVVQDCWLENPNERPNFETLRDALDEIYVNRQTSTSEPEDNQPIVANHTVRHYSHFSEICKDDMLPRKNDHDATGESDAK